MSLDWYDDKPKGHVPPPPPAPSSTSTSSSSDMFANSKRTAACGGVGMGTGDSSMNGMGMNGGMYNFPGTGPTSNSSAVASTGSTVLDADFAALVQIVDKVTSTGSKSEELPKAGVPKSHSAKPGEGWNFSKGGSTSSKEPRKPECPRIATSAEVERTVQNAITAKQEIVAHALRDKQKRALEESKRLARIDEEMKKLESAELAAIARLRKEVEQTSTNVSILTKESETKKAAMEKATADYVEVQERYQDALAVKKKKEEQLVDMILQAGKRKDDKLTELLVEIEKEEGRPSR